MAERVVRFRLPALAVALALSAAGCSGGRDAVDQQVGGQYRFVVGTGQSTVIPPDAARRQR